MVLIDEVLAVGDASFSRSASTEFARLKAEGRTIVFVTHDMGSVERFCDRAMLLERGRVVDSGDPALDNASVQRAQLPSSREEALKHGGPETLRRRPVAELLGAWFESARGERLVASPQGEPCWVLMEVRFHADTRDPLFAIALHDDSGSTAFATSTELRHGPTGEFRAGELAVVRIRFDNWLAPGATA